MTPGITELAIVVLIAAVLGIVARLFKQPTILAYLATGVVVGYFGFFHLDNVETFRLFSDIGIMLLLFLVGLEINYTSLRLVGKTSLIVGLAQIFFTAFFGFVVSSLLNFETIEALYIAITLTFSSTIIIVQLLSGKKALNSLYGKLSIGFLLVQDFVAILILIILAGFEMGGVALSSVFLIILEGIALFLAMLFLGRFLFPYIFDKIARSQELLFLSSLAWLFSLAALVDYIGFSIEIGGFLAGLALANSSEHYEIASKVRPLRDFFILVFFVILGSSVVLANISGIILPMIILSLFVLIGNPLIVLTIMGLMGYEKRISFLAGVTVAQISEFSLIVAALGARLGHISNEVVALITAVGVITITISTYMVVYADDLFRLLSPYLSKFERQDKRRDSLPRDGFDKPMILIGFHRTGQSVAANIPKKDLLVIDFDPEIISRLKKSGYSSVFGDISDVEIFEKINFDKTKIIISTNPVLEDNLTLISEVNKATNRKNRPKMVVRAVSRQDAEILYKNGADYVLLPHFISGHYLGRVLDGGKNLSVLPHLKRHDIKLLKKDERLV